MKRLIALLILLCAIPAFAEDKLGGVAIYQAQGVGPVPTPGTDGQILGAINGIPLFVTVGGGAGECTFSATGPAAYMMVCPGYASAGAPAFGPTPPTAPSIGELWYDTSTTPAVLKIWDGTSWITVSGSTNPTFNNVAITNLTVTGTLSLPNASVSDPMLAIAYSGVGACPANQFVITLNRAIAPTCAPITTIPGPVTISNPIFTGAVRMPDSSMWNSSGIAFSPGSRASTLDSLTSAAADSAGSLTRSADGTWNITNITAVVTVGPTPPVNPVIGALWYNTADPSAPHALRIWDGTHWLATTTGQNENMQ